MKHDPIQSSTLSSAWADGELNPSLWLGTQWMTSGERGKVGVAEVYSFQNRFGMTHLTMTVKLKPPGAVLSCVK